MAELRIAIPDNKVQLILDAFAAMRGIEATPQAFKAEIVREIKYVVKRYKVERLALGQEASVSQADFDLGEIN